MYKVVLILLMLMISICFGQTINEIKKTDKYIWGESISSNPNRADKEALSQLISQISVQVESNFINVVEEYEGNVEDYTELVVSTYSNVMLSEAKMIQEREEGKFKILRYMEKTKVKEVFNNRKDMIMDFIRSGNNAKKKYYIGDALKYYYWSLCLLKSHPDMEKITGDEVGMPGRLFTVLPEAIENIFNSININIQSAEYFPDEKRKCIILKIEYDKQVVTNLDYVYYTGDNWTGRLTTATNGLGVVELYGAAAKDMKEVKLRVEYIYSDKSKYNIALSSVIENTYIPYFAKADKKVSSFFARKPPKKDKVISSVIGDAAVYNEGSSNNDYLDNNKNKFIKTILDFKKAYEKGLLNTIANCFTIEGKASIKKLLQYGNAELIHTGKLHLQMVKLNDEYIVRSIPFKFNFPYSNREFIEDVVFILNDEAKISGINFALSDKSIQDIMIMGNDFGTVEQKQQIIHFMESYKTAYCLKNLDYIEKIFSDNALIVIGQKIKTTENIDNMYSKKLSDDEVFYIKMSKKDFIERLKRIFESNETINIHFEETQVKKVSRANDFVYGIQIAQNYYSTNYADFGYLFLMFDLNKPAEPKIYVRSWQPEKNKDGRIMGLEDFIIN